MVGIAILTQAPVSYNFPQRLQRGKKDSEIDGFSRPWSPFPTRLARDPEKNLAPIRFATCREPQGRAIGIWNDSIMPWGLPRQWPQKAS
jgi:hypothetical protein